MSIERSGMSRTKPAPAVASTGCSGLMSCLSLHRRPPPRRGEEQCWKRVQHLEEETAKLQGKRLALAQNQDQSNGEAAKAACLDQDRSSSSSSTAAAATATAKRRVAAGQAGGSVQAMAKLEDGSYLHEMARAGRRGRRLALQVSRPVVASDAATASQVLDKMATTTARAEDAWAFLAKMMPMKDIAASQHADPGAESVRKPARLGSGGDFLEAVLFSAMDRMEGLVLQGLKIQMNPSSANAMAAADVADRKRDETDDSMVVQVVLMQARDPEQGYGAIGDPIVGLLEASLGRRNDGKVKVEVPGMHVAGISFASGDNGRALMWSASLRDCRGSRRTGTGGGGQRSYVRNPDRAFQR